jgi:hypothetical protein
MKKTPLFLALAAAGSCVSINAARIFSAGPPSNFDKTPFGVNAGKYLISISTEKSKFHMHRTNLHLRVVIDRELKVSHGSVPTS